MACKVTLRDIQDEIKSQIKKEFDSANFIRYKDKLVASVPYDALNPNKNVLYGKIRRLENKINKEYNGKLYGNVISFSQHTNGIDINIQPSRKLAEAMTAQNLKDESIDYEPDPFDGYDEFELDYNENNVNNILPEYEKYIEYKKNLLSRLENRLVRIEAEKKKFASNNTKLKELFSLENKIKERIKGSEELGIDGLEKEIAKLEENPPIEKFNYYAEKDFDRLEDLSKSENPEDLIEARTIINFYEALGNFDIKEKHPIFQTDDIFDKETGDLILSEEIIDNFVKLKERAKSYENAIEQKEKKTIIDTITANDKVKNLYDNETPNYEELLSKNEGLKDTSWLDLFVMDVTNGIISDNGIMTQVMMNVLQNITENKLSYSKRIIDKINKLQPLVERELKKLGYGIKIPGIKGVSYDLFRSIDKYGQYKDSITQRYSSKFIDTRNEMIFTLNEMLSKARNTENPSLKSERFAEAYAYRDNWYRENTFVIDIRKIPEIINNEYLSAFKNDFNEKESESYAKKLKEILGEQGYKEEIEKQTKLLYNYQTMLDVVVNNILIENNVSDIPSLPKKEIYKINRWFKQNNPFVAVDSYYSRKRITQGNLKLNSSMAYNYAIPRKKEALLVRSEKGLSIKETKEETDYYDKRYETIENNEALKEFHNLLMEFQNKMFDSMPVEVRKKFSAYSLPALKKNLIEVMLDKEMSVMQKLSKNIRKMWDGISSLFGMKLQNNMSYATVDPITGQPQYKVNSEFLKSNKQKIDDRYFIELQRIKKALGLKANKKISKYSTVSIKNNQEVIEILAENLGIEPTIEAIQLRLEGENLNYFEIGKVLRNAITHQIVSENSFDLPKILKLYSHMIAKYEASQEALPIIEMMKKHYEQIKNPAVTNTGVSIINSNTKETRLDGERKNAIRQINSWFERAVLRNYGSKNEFGDSRIKRKVKLKLTNSEKATILSKKLQTTIDGRIYNAEEKIIKNKIPEILSHLNEELEVAKLRNKDTTEIVKAINNLKKIDDNLGKHFSVTSFFDVIFNFVRFMGLGWNLFSYLNNFMMGQVDNMIAASTGDYFKPENIYKANHIVKGSFFKNMSFGKFATDGAKKTRVLMDRYEILQDASNELQKASTKTAFSSFSQLSPYEGTRRTEYINQAPIMISILMDREIVSKDGKKSNVWDAMNPDGTLKDEFRTKENIENWENSNGKEYNDFKSHTRKTIVNIHGDYDDLRGNMASEYILGKAILMFKRWMTRQIYQRFAKPQVDLETGIKDVKGRYRSHTQASAFLHGSIIGLVAGPVGALIGGGMGVAFGKFYGANTGLGFLQELLFATKKLSLNMMGIPINNLLGKQVINTNNYSKLNKMSSRDVKNMRANLTEMSITLAAIGMYLFTKGFLWDDDDDDDDKRRQAHNLLANTFMQLSSEMSMYLNPVEMWDNTLNNLPVLRFLGNVGKTVIKAENLLEGKDTIVSGPNYGESALYNQVERTFFPSILKGNFGLESRMKRQFKHSAFDSWFYGDEKTAKLKIQSIKADTKKEFLNNDLSEKESEKLKRQIDKFYRKGRKESYSDVLNRVKKNKFKPEK